MGSFRSPQQPTEAHRIAHRFWANCSNSFLTNPEYYDRCETTLVRDILPSLGRPDRVLDIGCGSGRFTRLLARVATRVDAFDLSTALVMEARAAAEARDVRNIDFQVGDVIDPSRALQDYDLVSCMGVLSTIVDDWAFAQVVDTLAGATRPGGVMLLRDSTSRLPDGQLVETHEYATRYRNRTAYRAAFERLHFRVELDIMLAEFGTSVNEFLVLRAPGRS